LGELAKLLFPVKKAIKSLLHRSGVTRFLVWILPFPIIVGYHRVVELQDSMLVKRIGSVAPKEFEEHLAYFEKIGCQFENFYHAISSASSRSIALTFDDGFRDLYTNVFPILEGRSAPFTLFLITSLDSHGELLWQHRLYSALDSIAPSNQRNILVDAIKQAQKHEARDIDELAGVEELVQFVVSSLRPSQIIDVVERISGPNTSNVTVAQLYLARHELQEMADCGLSIEAHGQEHWILTNLTPQQLEVEIGGCADVIHERYGTRPRAYAVAHGVSNEFVIGEVHRHGYDYIVSGRSGLYSRPGSRDVPRIWPQGTELDLSWLLTKTLIATAILSVAARVSRLRWSKT